MSVTENWISEVDSLYNLMDEEEKGSLDADRI